MHHPREAVIDGVKFVLIPEALYEKLTERARDYYIHTGHGEKLLFDIQEYEDHPHAL